MSKIMRLANPAVPTASPVSIAACGVWRAVILPHFQDGILPLRKMDPREEQNLAFVGLTRARDFLTITLSRPARPSPFLSGMAVEVRQWP